MKAKKITLAKIKVYFKSKGYVPRHSLRAFKYAFNKLAEELDEDPFELLLFIIEDKPLNCFTHSYGFQNQTGRYISDLFSELYYEYLNNEL